MFNLIPLIILFPVVGLVINLAFGKKLGECHRVKNSRRLNGPLRTLFRPNK